MQKWVLLQNIKESSYFRYLSSKFKQVYATKNTERLNLIDFDIRPKSKMLL
jgi:hypothetical protein